MYSNSLAKIQKLDGLAAANRQFYDVVREPVACAPVCDQYGPLNQLKNTTKFKLPVQSSFQEWIRTGIVVAGHAAS